VTGRRDKENPEREIRKATRATNPVTSAPSKIVSAAIALAVLAWLWLLVGLMNAKFFVSEPPPNVVITFSDKGLTRLFAELVSLGIGSLGLVLAGVAVFARGARNRLLALAVVSNVAVCAVCVALLM
jgi:hypothetical protein